MGYILADFSLTHLVTLFPILFFIGLASEKELIQVHRAQTKKALLKSSQSQIIYNVCVE
jgi:hypothetical protein